MERVGALGWVVVGVVVGITGCGGGGSDGEVRVDPAAATVLAGETLRLSSVVTGLSSAQVTWTVEGTRCGAEPCGEVSLTGLYAAPALPPASDLPVAVRATAQADPGLSAVARLTVPAVVVAVSPASPVVALGGEQQLSASVTGTRSQGVAWAVMGPGSISATGRYQAPGGATTPAEATVTARSDVDPTKAGSATIRIPAVVVGVVPSAATVFVDGVRTFTAQVANAADAGVSWSLGGPGCTGAACGAIDGEGRYTPPASVEQPRTVQVRATSVADPTRSGTATVTVPPVAVAISTQAPTAALGASVQLAAAATNATDTGVTWSVTGPGSVDAAGRYTAPATGQTPAQATVTATARADATRSASVIVSIPAVTVAVAPADQVVIAGATRRFAATVGNATEPAVAWSVTGPGTIDEAGLYAAPASLATPAAATVKATSVADPGKSASATVSIPAVGITLSPATATVILGATWSFTASVTDATDPGVTWTVTGSGCAGGGCGEVSAGGVFTAPARFTTPATLTITARPRADPGRSASATVTIPEVSVAIYPAATTLAPARTRRHLAAVTNATDRRVTWTVSGAGCTAPCGSVDAAGLYASPAAPPTPPVVTVTATSTADPTKSASSPVTVSLDPNARLSGEFAFLLQGMESAYDALAPYQAVGSFVADGDGHVQGGIRDLVGSGTAILDEPFTGSYHVEADDQGSLDLSPGRSYRYALHASGDGGFLIDYDSVAWWLLSGVLLRQDPLDFAEDRITGDFVGALQGAAPGRPRLGALGRFHADGAGGTSGGAFDLNDGGDAWSLTQAAGSYTVGAGGRGAAVLDIPGSTVAHPMTLLVVDGQRLLLASRAPVSTGVPMLSGLMVKQTGGPFSAGSLGGPGILALQGRYSDASPSVAIGRLVPDGAGGLAGLLDRNEDGTFTASAPVSGTYQVAADGRGTITSDLGQLVFYLARPGEAFLLEAPGGLVRMGRLLPQSGGPFSGASLTGRFQYGTLPPATSSAMAIAGSELLDGALSWPTWFVKSAAGLGFGGGQGASAPYTVEASGRGVVASPGNAVFWVISPDAFVQIHSAPLTPDCSVIYVLER